MQEVDIESYWMAQVNKEITRVLFLDFSHLGTHLINTNRIQQADLSNSDQCTLSYS